MPTKHSPAFISTIIAKYSAGHSVASLCTEHNLPHSTIYHWLKQHRNLKSSTGAEVSYKDYYTLMNNYKKLEEKLAIIKAAECSTSAPLKEKLTALEKLYGQFSVHALCEALEVSRGTFYNHVFRRKQTTWYDIRREELRELVQAVFDESNQRFGAQKIHAVLTERGVKISTKYIAELMREMGLQSIGRNSKREYKKQIRLTTRQNKLQQEFDTSAPNQVWVSDTTCFKVKEQYFYICIILDLFSRKVVAHKISAKHSTYLVTSAFKRAFSERGHPQGLTFHSDQGVQYRSKAFCNLLRVNKVVQSFSRSGKPHDNAVAEAFFSALKKEELYRTKFQSEREFYKSVDNYMDFYNNERPHGTLAYKTPVKYEQMYWAKEDKAS